VKSVNQMAVMKVYEKLLASEMVSQKELQKVDLKGFEKDFHLELLSRMDQMMTKSKK